MLLAVLSPVASATAALLAYYILIVGPSPNARHAIESTVPTVLGVDALTVAALAPTVFVVSTVSSAVLAEVTARLTAAQARRRELEATFLDESD